MILGCKWPKNRKKMEFYWHAILFNEIMKLNIISAFCIQTISFQRPIAVSNTLDLLIAQ